MAAFAQHRCWNHTARAAICRCPSCSRYFCRECVVEHEARFVCSVCLRHAAPARKTARGLLWKRIVQVCAGVLLAWAVFYIAGGAFADMRAAEAARWRDR